VSSQLKECVCLHGCFPVQWNLYEQDSFMPKFFDVKLVGIIKDMSFKLFALHPPLLFYRETTTEDDSGIEGILNRLERQRSLSFGLRKEKHGSINHNSMDAGEDEQSADTLKDAGEPLFLFSCGPISYPVDMFLNISDVTLCSS